MMTGQREADLNLIAAYAKDYGFPLTVPTAVHQAFDRQLPAMLAALRFVERNGAMVGLELALKNYADSDPRPMKMGEKEAFRVGYRVAESRWLGMLRAKEETLEKWQPVVEAAIADLTDTPRPGTRAQLAVDALAPEFRPEGS